MKFFNILLGASSLIAPIIVVCNLYFYQVPTSLKIRYHNFIFVKNFNFSDEGLYSALGLLAILAIHCFCVVMITFFTREKSRK